LIWYLRLLFFSGLFLDLGVTSKHFIAAREATERILLQNDSEKISFHQFLEIYFKICGFKKFLQSDIKTMIVPNIFAGDWDEVILPLLVFCIVIWLLFRWESKRWRKYIPLQPKS
jgi:hypothetical protein